MANLTITCRWCGRSGHLVDDCPDRKPKLVTEKKAVTNEVVTNIPVTNVTNNEPTRNDVERVLEWREKNKEKYNAYQREYMRKKRCR